MFTETALSFSTGILNAVVDLVSFSGILYTIYPPLFLALLVYSVGGTAISLQLGKPLVSLNFLQEAKEADFRCASPPSCPGMLQTSKLHKPSFCKNSARSAVLSGILSFYDSRVGRSKQYSPLLPEGMHAAQFDQELGLIWRKQAVLCICTC